MEIVCSSVAVQTFLAQANEEVKAERFYRRQKLSNLRDEDRALLHKHRQIRMEVCDVIEHSSFCCLDHLPYLLFDAISYKIESNLRPNIYTTEKFLRLNLLQNKEGITNKIAF